MEQSRRDPDTPSLVPRFLPFGHLGSWTLTNPSMNEGTAYSRSSTVSVIDEAARVLGEGVTRPVLV